ncbi:MAG: hypothetical protein K6C68_10070 [Ruminococcus sp.]|nr:hypothetical protein [Ruminococcus sp.]
MLIFFDFLVSILAGIKLVPSNLHLLLKIGIVVVMFIGALIIMNITKFGIGLIAVTAVSLLFTWVVNGIIIAPYVEDNVWIWVLRVCAFLISFLGHLKFTIWDTIIKEKFFE